MEVEAHVKSLRALELGRITTSHSYLVKYARKPLPTELDVIQRELHPDVLISGRGKAPTQDQNTGPYYVFIRFCERVGRSLASFRALTDCVAVWAVPERRLPLCRALVIENFTPLAEDPFNDAFACIAVLTLLLQRPTA